MQYRIEAKVEYDGVIVLNGLPFHEGEMVEVVITPRRTQGPPPENYPLRGKPVRLEAPFDTVAEDEWSVLS